MGWCIIYLFSAMHNGETNGQDKFGLLFFGNEITH